MNVCIYLSIVLIYTMDHLGAISLKMDKQGDIPLPQSIPKLETSHNLIVDARIMNKSNLKQACDNLLAISNNTYGMTLNASLIDEEDYHTFIHSVLLSGKLRYLVSLDLSYIPLSYKSMQDICKFVNPIISGYNPLKRLTMTKCELKATGTAMIIEALCGNNFIEELYLTSNLATDYTVDVLVIALHDICRNIYIYIYIYIPACFNLFILLYFIQ